MFNDKGLTTTWIESFALKRKSEDKFSFLTSAFTVVICSILLILSAKIKVDLYPVPMTLQPLAILMIAMLCGRNIAVSAIGLYLFQGIIGFPVFAYGGGFAIAGIAIGELAHRGWGKNIFKSAAAMLIGLVIIYFFGIMQLSLIKGFDYAILRGMQPFIIGDFYKLLLASFLLPQIWKLTKKP